MRPNRYPMRSVLWFVYNPIANESLKRRVVIRLRLSCGHVVRRLIGRSWPLDTWPKRVRCGDCGVK